MPIALNIEIFPVRGRIRILRLSGPLTLANVLVPI